MCFILTDFKSSSSVTSNFRNHLSNVKEKEL